MSIFRKDKDKPVRSAEKGEPSAKSVQEAPEEMTDINEAAAESSSESQQNSDGMEEIYSTHDKRIKYKRLAPIEEEAALKRKAETKRELVRGKLEFSSNGEYIAPDVELKAELDPAAVVSEEIIEDISEVKSLRNVYIQDIDDIDISLDPMDNLREYERKATDKERYEERHTPKTVVPYQSSGEKIVARVPVYQHDSKVEKIFLKAGKFTEVVENEYDEYLRSDDPTISKNYHAMQKAIKPRQSLLFTLSQMAQKRKEEAELQKAQKAPQELPDNFDEEPAPIEKKKPSPVAKFFHIIGTLLTHGFSAKSNKKTDTSSDYDSREDEQYVLGEIKENIKHAAIHTVVFSLIAVTLLVLLIMIGSMDDNTRDSIGSGGAILLCGINLLLTIGMGVVARGYVIDGLRPLARFRGNSDTGVALAYLGCLLQSIVAMFSATSFINGEQHLYSFVAAFALALNTLGRLFMALRVKSNFSFLTSHSPAYAAKIYKDEETARRMVSGTTASKGVVAYQHITRFLSDFLKISYAPDPSEEISGKVTPITVISTLFVTIVYAIIFQSVSGTVSALAVMLCISIPFTALLAGNIPMLLFSKKMLKNGAMVAGYPSVRQFCDTSAVMVSAAELYPKGCVRLDELIPHISLRVDENLLMAAAILQEANSPIAPVFDELVAENGGKLPAVESVIYEEKSGLVGWINGERVLVGNRTLMRRYHITIPDRGVRVKDRQLTYIAVAGQAVATLLLRYLPSNISMPQLQRAEDSGLAFVVSTPDPNVTAEMIAESYGLFYRSIKIMPTGYANTIDEVTSRVEETSRAYVATRGRVASLARAVGGCIGLKSNITLGIVIEIFGLVLGVLLCATLALYSSVARLSIVELMIYILFWTAATIIAELIRRP